MRIALLAVAGLWVALVAPVNGAEPVVDVQGRGTATVRFTVPEGDYLFSVGFTNPSNRAFCKVSQLRLGAYIWPFARRVPEWNADNTSLHFAGRRTVKIRTNCAWRVIVTPWVGYPTY
jgi:hypothetical protein